MSERQSDEMTARKAAGLLGVQPHDDARTIRAAFEARDQEVRRRLTEATAPVQQAKYREVRERLAAAFGVLMNANVGPDTQATTPSSSPFPTETVGADHGTDNARKPVVAAISQTVGARATTSSRTFRQKLNHYGAIFFGLIAVLAIVVRVAQCVGTSSEEEAIQAATQLVAE